MEKPQGALDGIGKDEVVGSRNLWTPEPCPFRRPPEMSLSKYVTRGSCRAAGECSLPPERQKLGELREPEHGVGSVAAGDGKEREGVLT